METHDHQVRSPGAQVDRVLEQVVAVTYRCLLRELASGFAHELNQPLAAIAAYAEGAATLLRRDPTQVTKAVVPQLTVMRSYRKCCRSSNHSPSTITSGSL